MIKCILRRTDGYGGPKISRHIRDNCRGFVCHQMVMAASQFPIGCRFDGAGDTTATSTESLIRNQLAPSQSGNDLLTNVAFMLDRGYMGIYSLLWLILRLGGLIEASTWRRVAWNPYTYDQQLRENDERTLIPISGPKALYRKTYNHDNGTHLTAHAYCDGNKHVTIGMSSVQRENHWDFVLRNPSDSKWYYGTEEERSIESIQLLMSTPTAEVAWPEVLGWFQTEVECVTTTDCHPGWFAARMLSFTSSTVDRVINGLTKAPKELRREIGIEDKDYRYYHLQRYLGDSVIDDELPLDDDASEDQRSLNIKIHIELINSGGRDDAKGELQLNLIQRILQCSFLPRLTGKGKEYCKRGHDLEPAYATRLLDDSEFNGIQEIYKTGLVRKKTIIM
jgi:hypothetical protein